MVKNSLIALALLLFTGAFAQNGTISPYSYFGFGDSRAQGTVENQMMGGLQMYADSIHINLRNPAAYSKLRLTAYAAGISRTELRLKDAFDVQRTAITNLEYLAIGLPLSQKMGLGFGLMPFSSVGYSVTSQSINPDGLEINNAFSGSGGLNRVYFSFGYAPAKNLSLGATVNYNFGTLEFDRLQTVENVLFGTRDFRQSRINGFDFNYALNYTPKIKEKYTLFTHIGVNTQVNLVSKNSEQLSSFSVANGTNIETVEVNLDQNNLRNTELKIPTVTTIGLGFGEDKKWFLGTEYSLQAFSSFTNDFLGQDNVQYADASSIAFGGYFIPDYRSISSYLNRITYRAGLRYDETGLLVNGKEINNFGITFGLGLPLTGVGPAAFSNLNLGFELGRRGTTDAGLVEESYFKINVGLSLNDRWFIKRRIN